MIRFEPVSRRFPSPPEKAKRGKPSGMRAGRRTGKGKTVDETGSGKPASEQRAFELAVLIWTRSAHLHAGQRRQTCTPRQQAG